MDILFSKSIYDKNLNEKTLIEKREVSSNENLIMKKKKLIEISSNLTKIEYLEIFNIFIDFIWIPKIFFLFRLFRNNT